MPIMTIEVNQNGFQVTSRDRVLHGQSGLGKFLNFLAETASISDKPKQVIEDGVKAIREATKVTSGVVKP